MKASNRATETLRKRYDRWSFLYDFVERLGGQRLRQWRTLLWSKVEGADILEVGVGTGANFPFYPPGTAITAIDLSEHMLKQAVKKAQQQGISVHLEEMDVQELRFEDNTFDAVVASLVFVGLQVRGSTREQRLTRTFEGVAAYEAFQHLLINNREFREIWLKGAEDLAPASGSVGTMTW